MSSWNGLFGRGWDNVRIIVWMSKPGKKMINILGGQINVNTYIYILLNTGLSKYWNIILVL